MLLQVLKQLLSTASWGAVSILPVRGGVVCLTLLTHLSSRLPEKKETVTVVPMSFGSCTRKCFADIGWHFEKVL